MTATTSTRTTAGTSSDLIRQRTPEPISFGRLVGVEVRKMVDTRSSFWLLLAVGVLIVGAAAVVFLLQPQEAWTYSNFLNQISYPLALSVPMIGVLSVTSEWSQRGALTTFTLVPRRGRVLAAKAMCAAGIVVVTMAFAFALSALCTLVGVWLTDVSTSVWDVPVGEQLRLVLFMAVAMAVGFMLAVVLRNTPGALVGYLLIALVIPSLSSALAISQEWYRDAAPWVDLTYAQYGLLGEAPTGQEWAQLGTTCLLWLILPLTLGMRRLLRVEIR